MVHFATQSTNFATEVRTVRIARTAIWSLRAPGNHGLAADEVRKATNAYATYRRTWSPTSWITHYQDRRLRRPHLRVTDHSARCNQHREGDAMPVAAVDTITSRRNKLSEGQAEFPPKTVSVAEAARLCRCSDDTIRRRLHKNKLSGAFQDGIGTGAPWRVPVPALIEAGLCDRSVLNELDEHLNPNVVRLNTELLELRAELITERMYRQSAERMYAEVFGEVQYLRKTLGLVLAMSSSASKDESGSS
jgi:hypothetical protein